MRRTTITIAILVAALAAWWLWPREVAHDPPAVARAPEVARPSPGRSYSRHPLAQDPDPHGHDALPGAPRAAVADPRVAALEEDPSVDAICQLALPVGEAVGHLLVGEPTDPPPYNGRRVQVLDGRAYLPLLTEEYGGDVGTGWLTVPGYAPVRVTWDGVTDSARGRCGPAVVDLAPAVASVSGVVENAEDMPEGTVFVEGCGNQTGVGADGRYALDLHADGGPCIVQAFRREGFWASASEPHELDPHAGDHLTADMALPVVERGGIGILVEEADGRIVVTEVLGGGAGEDADLRSGDVIVSIDGERLDGLTLRDFVERAVGDAGTELELVVRSGDVERSVRIERRAI